MRGLHASRHLRRLGGDEKGATAVEYALMASAIAGVIVLTVFGVGQKVLELFQRMTWP